MTASADHRADQTGAAQDSKDLRADVTAALAALEQARAALAALPHPLAAKERATHDHSVTALAQRLRAALPDLPELKIPERAMDHARLTRLLQLVEPAQAAQLLSQLDEDLASVARALDLALPQADFDAIRRQTHILIAVAGSVGAVGLEAEARALNQLAQAPVPRLDPAAAQTLRGGLDSLRRVLAARRLADRVGP